MANKDKSVLVDTSFLITLYDDNKPRHEVAKKYFRYFLKNKIKIYLSVVVIAEFHQKQPIADVIASNNYMILPYNYQEGLSTAECAYNLGGVIRTRGDSRAKCYDDLKLIAQAKENKIDFIITRDQKTLARYVQRLNDARILSVQCILLQDDFNTAWFNDNQTSILDNA